MTLLFISTADLGEFLRQDLSSDAMAIIAINAACQVVIDELNQEVGLVYGDEILIDGSGTEALLLPELPVLGIMSVTLETDSTVLTEGTEWRLGDNGIIYRIDGLTWPATRAGVRVNYDHGWATTLAEEGSGDSAVAPIPDSIRLVALAVAARVYATGTVGVGGVSSETIGDYSYKLGSEGASASELTTLEKRTLSHWQVKNKPVWYRVMAS
jgi:hypothetical protein